MSSMMSHHSRRILPPGGTRKRKEREALGLCFSGPPPPSPTTTSSAAAATEAGEMKSSNRLLAGYMAHEFLTKGTLFGQAFDPARGEPLASSTSSASASAQAQPSIRKKEYHSYGELASLVKSDGTHIPGVVNPTQLSRWIQM